ncbi:discoidin domain-containing protein [Rarobacter incanus]|uniref:discoidin domain-containing protein n=1 Tax=Rarobacter incanus TaxID=153494 RepID=UPI0014769397|nr:discoidin domain-containing protein [Rarobacter incanus]
MTILAVGAAMTPSAHASSSVQASSWSIDGFTTNPSPSFGDFSWQDRAKAFDDFAYDWTDRGVYSTIRTDSTALNMPAGETTYKMPAYYGDQRVQSAGPNGGDGYQESVTQLASVISATLVGIDKSDQACDQPGNAAKRCDYVRMLQTFFRGASTQVAGNTPIAGGDGVPGTLDGWYQFLPNVLYSMVGEQYPDSQNMDAIQRSIANKFYDMVVERGSANANFNMWDYDFVAMKPYLKGNSSADNKSQAAELAVATAFVLVNAHERFGDQKYLTAAKWAMDAIERSQVNTYYEVMTLLQPYMAARMNALYGTHYDVAKGFRWLMEGSAVRGNWGTLGSRTGQDTVWGGKTVSGLQGSLSDKGPGDGTDRESGYVFAMNSFASPWFAATAKYDTQYANLVGKWLLNVNSAARFFFADQLAASEQYYGADFIDGSSTGGAGSATGWDKDDRAAAIAYESLQSYPNKGIRALSDVPERSGNWGVGSAAKGLGMYGSAWIGFMSVIHPTNVSNVLRIDLNKLDTYGETTYPTSLIYNPTSTPQQIEVPVQGKGKDLYDSITGKVVAPGVDTTARVQVPAGNSVVLVEIPSTATVASSGIMTLADGAPIAYDVADTGNIAEHKAVTTIPASAAASALVDGDRSTAWKSAGGIEASAVVDTGSVRGLGRVTLAWGSTHPRTVAIATSTDGFTWTEPQSYASLGGTETITLAARDARYVRVAVSDDAFELGEIGVSIADVARGARVSVAGTAGAGVNAAQYITDGSRGTRWESRTSDDQWAVVDLGSRQALGAVNIDWEGAYGKDYSIETSIDGVNWSVAAVEVGNSSAGVRTTSLAPGSSGRYVRWAGTKRGTSWAYSMWSLEVYGREGVTRVGQAYFPAGQVVAGSEFTVTGAGYDPGEAVRISVGGVLSTQVTADGNGGFAATLTAPAEAGDKEIAALGTSSGSSTAGSIHIVAAPVEPGDPGDPGDPGTPGATTTTVKVSAGTIEADGQDGSVLVSVSGTGDTIPVGQAGVSIDGAASQVSEIREDGTARFTIPATLSVGSHRIVATFTPSDDEAWQPSQSAAATVVVVKANATLSVSTGTAWVGEALTATVRVSTTSAWTRGRVWVTASSGGGTWVSVGRSKTAVVRLPAPRRAGKITVSAVLPVQDRMAQASAVASTHAAKARAKVTAKASKKRVKWGAKVRIRVRVTSKVTLQRAGTVTISVNGKKAARIRVQANGKATATIRIREKTRVAKIRAAYSGSANVQAAKSRTTKVKVRKG